MKDRLSNCMVMAGVALVVLVIFFFCKNAEVRAEAENNVVSTEESVTAPEEIPEILTAKDFWEEEPFEKGHHSISEGMNVMVYDNEIADMYRGEKILQKGVSHVIQVGEFLYYQYNGFIYEINLHTYSTRCCMDAVIPAEVNCEIIKAGNELALVKRMDTNEYTFFVRGREVNSYSQEEIGELEFYSTNSEREDGDYALSDDNTLYRVIFYNNPYGFELVEIATDVDSVECKEDFWFGTKMLLEYQKDGINYIVVPNNNKVIECEGFNGIYHEKPQEIGYRVIEAKTSNYDLFYLERGDDSMMFRMHYGIVVDGKVTFVSKQECPEIKRNYIPLIAPISVYEEYTKEYRIGQEEEVIEGLNDALKKYEEEHTEEIALFLKESLESGSEYVFKNDSETSRGQWGVKEWLKKHPEVTERME